jgi:FkbM family methyltransferase
MKVFLKSLPVVGPVFKWIGKIRWEYHCWKVDPERNLSRILGGRKNLFIVQIGSNDGTTGDPICNLLRRHPSWKALLVEPVPFLFERLRINYRGNNNVQFDNVAIAAEAGTSTFYFVDAAAKQQIPDLPCWFDQLGSFDRSHIARLLGDALKPFIVSIELATLPLSAVLDRNNVTTMDVLHIDTEGYDWIILRQLDLNVFQPKVILFEHKHLQDSEKREAVNFLERQYRISDLGGDYLCERLRREKLKTTSR